MNLHNLLTLDDTILDGVSVPEEINAETLKNEIIFQCGLLTPVYPEPDVFKTFTTHFFKARQWEFKHLVNIIKAEYSPIDNVSEERTEEREITRAKDNNDTRTINKDVADNATHTGNERTDSESRADNTTDTTTEQLKSAFNSDEYEPHTKDITGANAESKVENNSTTQTNNTDRRTLNDDTTDIFKGNENETTKDIYKIKRHGNIGVTTNFQLIEGELELLHGFNLYQWIAMQFRSAMFIEVF